MTRFKAILLCGWVLSLQFVVAQPISTIDSVLANPVQYDHQGMFLQVFVDSNLGPNTWMVHDTTGFIPVNFINQPTPMVGQEYLLVAQGDTTGGMHVRVNFYYAVIFPTISYTTIQDIRNNPVHKQAVILTGELTGFLSGSWDNYFFEDFSGTIQADFDPFMAAPDLWRKVELWGEVDYSNLGYLDINVWAWFYISLANIPEMDIERMFFPNPANDYVALRLPGNIDHLRVVDIHGRLMQEKRHNLNVLNVARWPSGLYLISLFDNGHLLGQTRLVVQH